MPPEAEPVMPASVVTVTASLISGCGIALSASRMKMNPGNAAMTAPKPYSDAVFIDASSAPAIADLLPSVNFFLMAPNAKATTVRMPMSSAPSTAHIAATPETVTLSVMTRDLAPERVAEVWFYPSRWGAIVHAAPQRARLEPGRVTLEVERGQLSCWSWPSSSTAASSVRRSR